MWAFITDICTVIIPTDRLKDLTDEAVSKKRYAKGGDKNRSLGALIDLVTLVKNSK